MTGLVKWVGCAGSFCLLHFCLLRMRARDRVLCFDLPREREICRPAKHERHSDAVTAVCRLDDRGRLVPQLSVVGRGRALLVRLSQPGQVLLRLLGERVGRGLSNRGRAEGPVQPGRNKGDGGAMYVPSSSYMRTGYRWQRSLR